VLRDGEIVGERMTAETSTEEIIRLMVGRTLQVLYEKPSSEGLGPVASRPVLLEARNLSREGRFRDVSFSLRAGEIVGMAGLVGAGRSDVAQALFGIYPLDGGEIQIGGKKVELRNPRDAMAHGLAYVPEDRQKQGLLMPTSIARNMTLPIVRDFAQWGLIREARERRAAADYVERLRIVLRQVAQPVNELSGGNQQKVVLSKWLMTTPKVIIMDEPTRGIDVGAKSEIYELMHQLATHGISIIMISSEFPELLAMCDRIVCLAEGRVTGELPHREATLETLMHFCTLRRQVVSVSEGAVAL